jgi:tRNA(fMet)-specific endonuclease VapC
MRRYLLDTGVLVHYARRSSLYQNIEDEQGLTKQDCIPFISVVTMGEIISFGIQQNWGETKIQAIKTLLSKLIILDINSSDTQLIDAYAEIDSYSKNKLPNSILGHSITMGKNDLWIAATAKVAHATLITIDGDFDHLNGIYYGEQILNLLVRINLYIMFISRYPQYFVSGRNEILTRDMMMISQKSAFPCNQKSPKETNVPSDFKTTIKPI